MTTEKRWRDIPLRERVKALFVGDKRWRDIPRGTRIEKALISGGIAGGLVLLSFLFAFVVDYVLEAIYGAKALYFMSMTQPQGWLLKNKWLPIFQILVILVLSLPLWKNYPKEKMHAAIFFSATIVFYLFWGFVLRSVEGTPSASRFAHAGYFVLFFIPLFHLILLERLRIYGCEKR